MGWGKGKFYFADNPGAASASLQTGQGKARIAQEIALPSCLFIWRSKNPISADDYMTQVSKRIASGMDRDAAIALVDSELKRQNIDGIVDPISGGMQSLPLPKSNPRPETVERSTRRIPTSDSRAVTISLRWLLSSVLRPWLATPSAMPLPVSWRRDAWL